MKKLFAVIMVALLVLTGCSKKEENTAVETKTEDAKVEITWWAYPTFATVDGVAGKYEESVIAKFNEKFPNITVKVEMLDFKTGPEKTITALQGGTGPDVLFDAPGRIVDYGTSGYLVNLTDFVKETGLVSDSDPLIIKASSDKDGNVWMYPLSSAPFMMAVSKNALEEAGLLGTVDFTKWTTEEFIDLSKKMQEKGYKGVQIYALNQGGDQGTRAFISNLTGARIINDDLTAYTMDTPEAIKAFELVKQGMDEGWLEGSTSNNAGDAITAFVNPQNSTFWAVNLWSLNLQKQKTPDLEASGIEVIHATLPSPDGKANLEYLVNGFAIFDNKDEAKIAAAKEFVKFISDDPVVGKENVIATNAFPVRNSFGDLYPGNELMNFHKGLTANYGVYYNTVPGFANMRPFWFGSLQSLITGEKTPEEVAKYFTSEANKTLAE